MNYSAQHCSSSGQTTSPAFLAGSSLLGGLITGFWRDLFCPMLPDSWLRHRPQLNTYMELLFGNNQFPPPCSHTTKRRRKIRYKSPEGRVFHSRGPLIRFISFTFKTLSMSLFWQISLWEQPQEKTAAENIEKTAENQPGSPVWRVAQKWQVNIFSPCMFILYYYLERAGSSSIWTSTGISFCSCDSVTIIMSTCQRCDWWFFLIGLEPGCKACCNLALQVSKAKSSYILVQNFTWSLAERWPQVAWRVEGEEYQWRWVFQNCGEHHLSN